MFDFRNGMLGVVIVTIAIAASLFGSYLAGIESVEHDVIKYKDVADVTGLFDTEQSPEYVDYDPSTNYTGYYSDNSYSEGMNKYYFAQDEVGFIPNERSGKPVINNYKIETEPTIGEPTELDMGTLEPTIIDVDSYFNVHYIYNTNGDYLRWATYGSGSSHLGSPLFTLKSLLQSMDIPEGWNEIRITLGDDVNWDEEPSGEFIKRLSLNAFLVIPINNFVKETEQQRTVNITSPNMDIQSIQNLTQPVYKPLQSFQVNLKDWSVLASNSTDITSGNPITYTADSLIVCIGSTWAEGSRYDHIDFNKILNYELIETKPLLYLDPNSGVWLKEGA